MVNAVTFLLEAKSKKATQPKLSRLSNQPNNHHNNPKELYCLGLEMQLNFNETFYCKSTACEVVLLLFLFFCHFDDFYLIRVRQYDLWSVSILNNFPAYLDRFAFQFWQIGK